VKGYCQQIKEGLSTEEKNLNNLIMNEKLILKEIDNLNNTYDKSIEDLDVKINKANIRRVTICNKY